MKTKLRRGEWVIRHEPTAYGLRVLDNTPVVPAPNPVSHDDSPEALADLQDFDG